MPAESCAEARAACFVRALQEQPDLWRGGGRLRGACTAECAGHVLGSCCAAAHHTLTGCPDCWWALHVRSGASAAPPACAATACTAHVAHACGMHGMCSLLAGMHGARAATASRPSPERCALAPHDPCRHPPASSHPNQRRPPPRASRALDAGPLLPTTQPTQPTISPAARLVRRVSTAQPPAAQTRT